MMNTSNKVGAFLLIWLGAACGGSFSASSTDDESGAEGGNSTDVDRSTDGGTYAYGASLSDRDRSPNFGSHADSMASTGGGSIDSGSYTDVGNATDRANTTGGGNTTDGGNIIDGGHTADSGPTSDSAGTVSTLAVNLRTAANFAVLAESAISTVPTSEITGDIAVSPAAVTYITGFSLTADPTNEFSTSLQVIGKVFAANHVAPTPSNLTIAIGDMQRAFTDAAGRAPNVTGLGTGDIGGMTLGPGVYKWASAVVIPKDVTLAGSATDVWIFQIAQTLTLSSETKIVLTGGARPKNVFWQTAGVVDLGTYAHLEGVVLTQTSIALHTGASVKGRLLAQTAITLDSSSVEPGL